MLISENYKKRLKELSGIISEDANDDFAASDSRIPFSLDLMTQAISQGREVGILYKGDKMSAPSGKYRLIYPVAMGMSTAGNRVIRAIHKTGQSESAAKHTGVRSAEIKNVWRLFKVDNIKGMWFTGGFFNYLPNEFNPNDKGMATVEVAANLLKIKKFQADFIAQKRQDNQEIPKIKRFKDREPLKTQDRPIQKPIQDPETRLGQTPIDDPADDSLY